MRRTAVLLALLLIATGTVIAQGVDPPDGTGATVEEETGVEELPPGRGEAVAAPAGMTTSAPIQGMDRAVDLEAKDLPNDAGGSINLTWVFEGRGTVPDSLAILRRGPSGVEERIATIGGINTNYRDTTTENGTSYSYWVESLRADGTTASVSDESTASSSAQWFHSGRIGMFVILFLLSLIIVYYIETSKRGKKLYIREIAGLAAVDDAVGRATEMGKPVLYIPGIMDMDDIQTIASMVILGRVAIKTAEFGSALMVPTCRSVVMSVAQEVVKESYLQAGRPDAFNKEDIQYLTDDQFGYAAGVDGIMVRERPAAIFMLGTFYAESLILAETGRSVGAIQIAGTAMPSQIPFFVAACDYTLIGEELFAASAYLSREPKLLGSLKGQDAGKLFFIILIILGVIAASLGGLWEPMSRVADFLRSLVAVS